MLGLKIPTSEEQVVLLTAACMQDRVINILQVSYECKISERQAMRKLENLVELEFLKKVHIPRTQMNLETHKVEVIGGFTNGYQVTPEGLTEIAAIRNICERALRVRRDNYVAGDSTSAIRWVK